MQVKKFEAKSMKEALEMVKVHLGPDAIILSARDNSKGFGLLGEKSVEVTAAISETQLRQKQLAEKKLNEGLKRKYSQSSARVQKAFIEKAFLAKKAPAERIYRSPTDRRYIDILDEEESNHLDRHQGSEIEEAQLQGPQPEVAEARIRGAAQRALQEIQALSEPRPKPSPRVKKAEGIESEELMTLRKEIMYLRKLITGFQKVPQNMLSMHPGAEDGLAYELSESFQKLQRAGISKSVIVPILKEAQETLPPEQLKKSPLVDAWVVRYLLNHIQIAENRTRNKVHVFTGPPGQGKTSCLLKMASHLVICDKKKIGILTMDSQKLGAAEQLRIYAQILNVPFAVIRRKSDWEIVSQKLSHVDHLLVDAPGMSLKSITEVDTLRELFPPITGGRSIHYVQSVLAKDEEAIETANRYKAVGFDDVIFTHLDQAGQHGLIYNFQQKLEVPLHSFGIGPQVPEDFEPATKERVIDLIFKLTKLKKREASHE